MTQLRHHPRQITLSKRPKKRVWLWLALLIMCIGGGILWQSDFFQELDAFWRPLPETNIKEQPKDLKERKEETPLPSALESQPFIESEEQEVNLPSLELEEGEEILLKAPSLGSPSTQAQEGEAVSIVIVALDLAGTKALVAFPLEASKLFNLEKGEDFNSEEVRESLQKILKGAGEKEIIEDIPLTAENLRFFVGREILKKNFILLNRNADLLESDAEFLPQELPLEEIAKFAEEEPVVVKLPSFSLKTFRALQSWSSSSKRFVLVLKDAIEGKDFAALEEKGSVLFPPEALKTPEEKNILPEGEIILEDSSTLV